LESEMAKLTGLRPADVARVTFVPFTAQAREPLQVLGWVTLVTTVRPYDRSAVQQALTGQPAGMRTPRGVPYQVAWGPKLGVAFLTDRVLVLGQVAGMDWYLGAKPRPEDKVMLGDVLPALAKGHPLVAFAAPPKLFRIGTEDRRLRKKIDPLSTQLAPDFPPALKVGLPLLDLQEAVLTLDSEPDVRLQLRLVYPEGDKADKARAA